MAHSNSYNEQDKQTLLKLAHQSIGFGFEHNAPPLISLEQLPPHYTHDGCSFVTLKINQQLRGCIGSLKPHQALIQDIATHAFNAAFKDTRFSPLTQQEFALIKAHISVINPAEDLTIANEQQLLTTLQPHVDGLILQDQQYHSTFLPSVWEQISDPSAFLQQLKLKAGLPADHWSDTIRFQRYTVTSWGEE